MNRKLTRWLGPNIPLGHSANDWINAGLGRLPIDFFSTSRGCLANYWQPKVLRRYRALAFVCLIVGFLLPVGVFAQETLPPALQKMERQRTEVIAKALPAAVAIFSDGGNNGGSGVVISADGYALTNFHVVQACREFMKCSMSDGVLYDAVIVGIDATGDLALIKLLGRDDFPTATIGDSDTVQPGDACFAIGNPFLLATDFQPTVSYGIVSGTHRYQYPSGSVLEYADCLQFDTAINPGNSGGPLFNANGDLIGINGRGSFEKRGRVNVGVGYAISANQTQLFLSHLKAGRVVDHATAGFTVATDDQGNVRIDDILESSQAYRRGVREDDLLVDFAGREIRTVNQYKNVLGIFPKGWRVPVTFRRDQNDTTVYLRLQGVHTDRQLIQLVSGADERSEKAPGQPDPPEPKGPSTPEIKTPEGWGQLYEARRGFANYHFNYEHLRRVWTRMEAVSNFSKQTLSWRLIGKNQAGQSISIVLGDRQSGIKIDDEAFVVDTAEDLVAQVQTNDLTYFLLSLHMWRKMLVLGPEKFGQCFYFGRVPDRSNKPVEVLVATREVIESNLLFSPQTGLLTGLEVFLDDDQDPCEVTFSDFQTVEELTFPQTLELRVGNGELQTVTIDRIEFLDKSSVGSDKESGE